MSTLKPILVYDVNVLPYGMGGDQMIYMFKEHNVVFYNGTSKRNDKPVVYGCDDIEIKLVDTSILKASELKDLLKAIEEVYDVSKIDTKDEHLSSVYNKEYCNDKGKIVSKYVFYVRNILGISKEQEPMTGKWLTQFEEYKLTENAYFPLLTLAQIAQLDAENQANRV